MHVSVCVITYNHEPYIASCLESIVMQETDFPFEIVIRDDGSQDRTVAIIEHFQKQYPHRIKRLPTFSNLGMTANLMTVLSAAEGNYIAICEGDDYWIDKDKLQKQCRSLEAYPAVDLCCHPAFIEKDQCQSKKYLGYYAQTMKVISALEVIKGGGGFIATPSIMFRKSLLRKLPDWFIDLPIADYFIQIYGSLRGGCLYLSEPMAVYRQSTLGSWSEMMTDSFKKIDFFNESILYLNKLKEDLGPAFQHVCDQLCAGNLCRLSLAYLEKGCKDDFKRSIEASWRCYQKLSIYQAVLFYLRFSHKCAKFGYWLYRKFKCLIDIPR